MGRDDRCLCRHNAAVGWTNLAPMVTKSITASSLALSIPDGEATGVSHVFASPDVDNLRVEHVTVHVSATHGYRGNLEWWLTSPSGATARLARVRVADSDSNVDWTFMTTHFWGERSVGNWVSEWSTPTAGDAGILNDATLTFYGTPEQARCHCRSSPRALLVGREGGQVNYQITASNGPTSYDASGPAFRLVCGHDDRAHHRRTNQRRWLLSRLAERHECDGHNRGAHHHFFFAADLSLSEAVDQPETTLIVTFGDADWGLQSATTHDGIDAAQSGDIADDESTDLELLVVGPTNISFQWKVSSETGDHYWCLP